MQYGSGYSFLPLYRWSLMEGLAQAWLSPALLLTAQGNPMGVLSHLGSQHRQESKKKPTGAFPFAAMGAWTRAMPAAAALNHSRCWALLPKLTKAPSLSRGGQAFHATAAVTSYSTPRLTQACFTLPCPLQWINGLTPYLCSDLTCSLIDGSTCFLAFWITNTREGITIQKKQLLERRKESQQVFYRQFPSFVPR